MVTNNRNAMHTSGKFEDIKSFFMIKKSASSHIEDFNLLIFFFNDNNEVSESRVHCKLIN